MLLAFELSSSELQVTASHTIFAYGGIATGVIMTLRSSDRGESQS